MNPVSLPLINIDKRRKTAMVISKTGNKFPVKINMPNWKLEDVQLGDNAIVVKSTVSREWLMIDFTFKTHVNYAIHNMYNLETGDLIYDDGGKPYE